MHASGGGILSISSGAVDPFAAVDGRSNAPAGTPVYATVLNGFPTATPPGARVRWPTVGGAQPPWEVCGVDFHAGLPSSVTPADPFQGLTPSNTNLHATLKAAGGSYSGVVITFSGVNNATILGWNFGLNGGQQLFIQSCSNFTIDSCDFKVGSNLQKPVTVDISVNGFTIRRSRVDGNNQNYSPNGGLISLSSYNATLIEYTELKNAWGQLIEAGTSANGQPSHTVRYTVLHDSGLGFPVDGTHGDWVQYLVDSGNKFASVAYTYCLFMQTDALGVGARTQGMSMFSAGGLASNAGECDSETFFRNTIIATSNCLDPLLLNNSYLNGSATCNENYSYVVGSGGTAWLFFGQNNGGPGGVGPFTGTLNPLTGNINMDTGASFNVHDG